MKLWAAILIYILISLVVFVFGRDVSVSLALAILLIVIELKLRKTEKIQVWERAVDIRQERMGNAYYLAYLLGPLGYFIAPILGAVGRGLYTRRIPYDSLVSCRASPDERTLEILGTTSEGKKLHVLCVCDDALKLVSVVKHNLAVHCEVKPPAAQLQSPSQPISESSIQRLEVNLKTVAKHVRKGRDMPLGDGILTWLARESEIPQDSVAPGLLQTWRNGKQTRSVIMEDCTGGGGCFLNKLASELVQRGNEASLTLALLMLADAERKHDLQVNIAKWLGFALTAAALIALGIAGVKYLLGSAGQEDWLGIAAACGAFAAIDTVFVWGGFALGRRELRRVRQHAEDMLSEVARK